MVVIAHKEHSRRFALKIRRVDANRAEMWHEAKMLKMANAVGVGPRLLNVSINFLMMSLIEGKLLPKWIEELKDEEINQRMRRVLHVVLEQCWKLDGVGIDHGELSTASKHIIVDKNDYPWILDFESASLIRRASNVTSICNFLFIGSQLAKTINEKLRKINREELITALKGYKKNPSRRNIDMILTHI
jgi:putative serine/threonine protein kinase